MTSGTRTTLLLYFETNFGARTRSNHAETQYMRVVSIGHLCVLIPILVDSLIGFDREIFKTDSQHVTG